MQPEEKRVKIRDNEEGRWHEEKERKMIEKILACAHSTKRANMQTIIDEKIALTLAEKGYFYIMHRFQPEKRINFINDMHLIAMNIKY